MQVFVHLHVEMVGHVLEVTWTTAYVQMVMGAIDANWLL